ncbi:MAG: integrase core domain-containing protein [Candidatus Competibacteraceae bacterium]|nr:integrase core domain-containing protein [Candidatus Competibacteraceae bacterium]
MDTLEQAQQQIAQYVEQYNQSRLHSAIGYITPADKLAGKADTIFAQCEDRLAKAREQGRQKRLRASQNPPLHHSAVEREVS